MARYSVATERGAVAWDAYFHHVYGNGTTAPKVSAFVIGSRETADAAFSIAVSRTTTAGTGGATPTIAKWDPSSPAAVSVVRSEEGAALTGAPTITAGYLFKVGLHQRATMARVLPGDWRAIIAANNGILLYSEDVSGGTPIIPSTVEWYE